MDIEQFDSCSANVQRPPSGLQSYLRQKVGLGRVPLGPLGGYDWSPRP